jgi:trehalose 6-phosphate phosphatase
MDVGSTAGDGPPLVDGPWLRTLETRAADASGLLVCLDFDGTLAPIVAEPDDATMRPENRTLLRRLADEPAVTVAVVSGRSLADLRERVGVAGIHYAGNHGLELAVDGERRVPPAVQRTQPAVEHVVDRLRAELDDVTGCLVEDKTYTATVHVRQTPTERRPGVLATVQEVVESVDGLETSDGKAIVEIRPDVEVGKGRVVERLVDREPARLPLFVGDDVTDEDGFEVVADHGTGVLVGDRDDTAASVRVPGPGGVALLLNWLAERCV